MASNASKVDELTEALQRECWDAAFRAFGTASIFERRALSLKRKLRLLSYVGIVVPIFVGGSVMGFGQFDALPVMIAVGSVVGVAQMAVSTWALTANWVDGHSYAVGSNVENKELARKYEELASRPPTSPKAFQEQVKLLNAVDKARQSQDYQQGVTLAEKRFGMRSALWKYDTPCHGCKTVPTSMTPGECDVCGKF